MKKPARTIVLETLNRVNAMINSHSNALVISRSGNVDPETAYIELVRELLDLSKD
ncbi:hypothetical protein UFOVP1329_29 [uncultured Caudovirales phage]|uniref:Uncharacterized protein n=1 Tax=uncultured Caudovirales phage TaxID=2100421 RepID=A0A6J5QYT8_9CAUD|nr:hypothetical protein UFOVP1150_10 [uncultured Caudovirales phage]CAB4199213.1 hypothetical protein UFOVP1329_29 [uncultured Caudovirales phage]CAB4218279.1 hypothetical protein UFOVP1595_7 [uncultured Caudovirales phage]